MKNARTGEQRPYIQRCRVQQLWQASNLLPWARLAKRSPWNWQELSDPELPPAKAGQAPSLTKPQNQGDQVLSWKLVYFCSCFSLFLEMNKNALRDSIYQQLCRPLLLGKYALRRHSLQAQLLLSGALAPAGCSTSGLYSLKWPTTAQQPPQPGEGKARLVPPWLGAKGGQGWSHPC